MDFGFKAFVQGALAAAAVIVGSLANATPLHFSFHGSSEAGLITGVLQGVDADGDGWVTAGSDEEEADEIAQLEAFGHLKGAGFEANCESVDPSTCREDVVFKFVYDPSKLIHVSVKTDLSVISVYFEDYFDLGTISLTGSHATVTTLIDSRYLTTVSRQLPLSVAHVVPAPPSFALALLGIAAFAGLKRTASGKRHRVRKNRRSRSLSGSTQQRAV